MSETTTPSISKIYANVNSERPDSYSNYDNYSINWSSPDSYQIVKRIGKGKYSDVFLGVDVRNNMDIVIKVLKPVRRRKIRRESKILENLRGHPNIVILLDNVLSDNIIPSFIFEYVNNLEYTKLLQIITLNDIKFYMQELAKALLFSHSNGIMHRDVKPQNIMIDHSKRQLKLVDWGLAEFYHSGTSYNVRVASRYYKSPELLVDYRYYDYSLDIWSYGCVLAGFIFKKDPLFQGSDNKDQLVQVVKVLGSLELKRYLAKFKHKLDKDLASLVEGYEPIPFESFITNPDTSSSAIPCAIDLIKLCLTMDHTERITAPEILNHHFINPNAPKFECCCNNQKHN